MSVGWWGNSPAKGAVLMPVRLSQNLSGALEHVAAAYRAGEPPPAAAAPRQAVLLSSLVGLVLDEPSAVEDLREASARLIDPPDLEAMLPRITEQAIQLVGAEFGNAQLVDPRDSSLVLVTASGFDDDFVDYFSVVHGGGSVCGRAGRQGFQAVVDDVRDDAALARHQGVFRASGVRAVQSTPLVDHSGRMVGMVSTHMSQPGRPAAHDLRMLELYAQIAAEVIARRLGPARATGAAFLPSGVELADRADYDPQAASLADHLMSDTVYRIFSAGLRLTGALQLMGNTSAAQHVQAGIDELDETIRAIQRAALATARSGRDPRRPQASRDQAHRPRRTV
ncbi:GAF domain-containing protein [Streptomyces sp. NPDC090022]|uniref:GAF domain-containing protein n=1 Tax=Streptomyces sp. NPDC090022 TaxID=3365920 RepID=UPI0037F36956